ncbi:MAG: hypothetical protein FD176_273 [Rhodospirillaceae bacterium]|nr:MAG: hypothetical protein FD176_273 [Rhodospirillaceae bacterium]TNC97477.1 MAG: hypothetical protein FD119_1077 [Stygiobacter sp.]
MTDGRTRPYSVLVRLTALAMMVVLLATGLATVEMLLATFWPITTAYRYSAANEYEFQPHLDIAFNTPEFSTRIRTDADGFRLPEAIPHGTRVLFLGDSFVFGHGVNGEQALPHRLQRLSQGRLSVVNAGVPGYDTRRETMVLENRGQTLRPQIVLVGFVLNDVLANSEEFRFSPTATGPMRRLPLPALGSLVEYLISDPAFVLFRMGVNVSRRFDHLACRLDGACQQGWAATRHWLARLKKAAGTARVVLVRIPMPGEEPNAPAVIGNLGEAARLNGMDFIDLAQAPGLLQTGYYQTDGHWNADGHDMAARYLWSHLALPDTGEAGR